MSTIKVNIKCRNTVYYDQEIHVSLSDYEKIKDLDNDDIDENDNPEAYEIISNILDFRDVCSAEESFTDVFVTIPTHEA